MSIIAQRRFDETLRLNEPGILRVSERRAVRTIDQNILEALCEILLLAIEGDKNLPLDPGNISPSSLSSV